MKLQLLAVGELERRHLDDLRGSLAKHFCIPIEILPANLNPEFAFHAERQQYHSSEILARMQTYVRNGCWRLLGVTAQDLYIPILTFVFGEAQLNGQCALVSLHRLRQEFYGLPADPKLQCERLLKECVHELGHTMELTHCDDYTCVMAASHAVEWIDIKDAHLCPVCHGRAVVV